MRDLQYLVKKKVNNFQIVDEMLSVRKVELRGR